MKIERQLKSQWSWNLKIMLAFFAYVLPMILLLSLLEPFLRPYIKSLGDLPEVQRGALVVFLSVLFMVPMFLVFFRGILFGKAPYLEATKQEQKAFAEKYGINSSQLTNWEKVGWRYVFIWLLYAGIYILIIQFIPPSIKQWVDKIFMFSLPSLTAYFIYRMKKKSEEKAEVLINKIIPNTKIDLDGVVDFITSPRGGVVVKAQRSIKGRFKGREVYFQDSGSSFGAVMTAGIQTSSQDEFELKERDLKWKSIEGLDFRDLFEKRFELKGLSVGQLPKGFVQKVLEYKKNLHLEVKKNTLSFANEDLKLEQSLHTVEGIVLFLDFLDELARELEKKSLEN